MLAADRDVLYSQFTRNSLQVHSKLVHLYLANLNAIATQAAIVADLGFGGIKEVELPTSHIRGSFMFAYLYYIFCMISMMAALMALSQSTILVIYGHSLFIKGESSEDSLGAVGQLRSSQLESGFWGAVCTLSLLCQACVFTWANISNYRVGIVVSLVYLVAIYQIYTRGIAAIMSFLIIKEIAANELNVGSNTDGALECREDSFCGPTSSSALAPSPVKRLLDRKISWVKQIASPTPSAAEKQAMEERRAAQYESLRKKIRESSHRGVLWAKFHEAFNTRCFVKCYAVMERGRLDIYRSKQDFVDLNNAVNKKPIRLKQYSIETDPRVIDHCTPPHAFLGYSKVRAAMTGVTEVGLKDFYSADFDVFLATKELRMTLLPVTSTEISHDEPMHFMAEDKEMFQYWVNAFTEVLGYYHELNLLNSEENHKKRISNVEEAVNSAHNRYAGTEEVVMDVEPKIVTTSSNAGLSNSISAREPLKRSNTSSSSVFR